MNKENQVDSRFRGNDNRHREDNRHGDDSRHREDNRLISQIQKLKVSAVCTDSRKMVPGSLFVALKGQKEDGHSYIVQAIKKGACALVVENKSLLKKKAFAGPVFVVKNTRKILPLLLNEFYDYPSEKMFCVGVTGTNGKTTVSHIMAFLFSLLGWRTGLIGTINNRFEGWEEKSQLTTPDHASLHGLLNRFYQKGAQAVVMEVSSIALDQGRTAGVDFNLAVFTNLSQDHLDYHSSLSSYWEAKKKLFLPRPSRWGKNHFQGIINLDEPYGIKLSREISVPFISYGQKTARMGYKVLSSDLSGSHFEIYLNGKTHKAFLPLPGLYNVSNAVASLCGVYNAGFPLFPAISALKDFKGVPGRLQKVRSSSPLVFVDYAHTPSALKSVLSFLREHKKQFANLCTVFGCGGERDQTKRSLMAEVAETFSDHVFLTSDNPRGEDPMCIVEESLKGVQDKTKFTVEPDRKQAIHLALKKACPKDIVLIAGKGHETVQIIGSQRHYFSDREVVQEYYSNGGRTET